MSANNQPVAGQPPSYGAFSAQPVAVGNYQYGQPQGPVGGQWGGPSQVAPEQFGPGGSDPSKWAPQGVVGTQVVGAGMVMPPGAAGAGPGGEPVAALPIEQMDVIPGYDTAIKDPFAPPPYEATETPVLRQTTDFNMQQGHIDDAAALRALQEHAKSECCWGTGAANNSKITRTVHRSFLHYALITWSESRKNEWQYEPFMGQVIDSPAYGPAPLPWDVYVQPPAPFTEHTAKVEVPHTASVKPCHWCFGRGRRTCTWCHGSGHKHCCHRRECGFCHGTNHVSCHSCGSTGSTHCHNCNGRGSLKCFIQLTVTWKVTKDDHIAAWNDAQVPLEKVRQVSGNAVFDEQQIRVAPLANFPDADIAAASQRLMQKHLEFTARRRVLLQKQTVRSIPVGEYMYVVGEKTEDPLVFFVYGLEHRVHAPNYPQRCCCLCTLL